jgi:tetratricopeptide (TPR) repeat protein
VADCLDDSTLRAFAEARLDATAREAAEAHLSGCGSCRDRAQTWTALAAPTTDHTLGSASGTSGPHLIEGDRIGPYRLVGAIGHGGMGVVWRARDPRLDRWVALKVMRADVGEGSMGRARLLREAQAMARLSHPNVVAVHDVGEVGDGIYVAMELVEGVDLADWLGDRRGWREIVPVFLGAARGLAAAHAAGLVHRDFKPANVLVGKDGRARVSDFGLARTAGPAGDPGSADHWAPATPVAGDSGSLATPLTLAGTVLGTPSFMSPEQLEGRAIDARADQFSFCVALWQALYRELPFGHGDPRQVRVAIAAGPPRPPARQGRETPVPAWLDAVVRRGLSERADTRWPSMDALVTTLERGLGRRRRFAIAAGVATVAVAWLATVLVTTRTPAGACGVVPPDPWDAASRAAVERAFLGASAKAGQDAFTRADEALTAVAARLRTERERTCAPARKGGPATDEERLLRLGCLDQERGALGATVGVLREADAEIVVGVDAVLSTLPDIRVCSEQRRLRQAPPLPSDPKDRTRYLELHRQISEAAALVHLGKKPRAEASLREVLPAVRERRWVSLEGAALLALGSALAQTARHDDGLSSLWQAWLAAQTAGDDRLAGNVAIEGLVACSYRPADARDALRWADLGEAVWKRLDEESGLLRILYNRSTLERNAGRPEKGLALAQRVLDRSVALGEPTRDLALSARRQVATLLGDLGRFDEQVEMGRQALKETRAHFGASHPETAFAYLSLARDLGNVQLLDEGKGYSEEALAIYRNTLGEKSEEAAWAFDTAAGLARDSGDLPRALDYARHAVAAYEGSVGLGATQASTTLSLLGDVLQASGQLEEGEALLRRAIAIEEKSVGPDHDDLAESQRALGDCLLAAKRPKEAVTVLARSLAEAERIGEPRGAAFIRFRLAAARWEARADRPGARKLAEQARAVYQPPLYRGRTMEKREREEIDAWLAGHR